MIEVLVTLATAAAERFVVIADKARKATFSRVRERLGLLRSALPWCDRQRRGDSARVNAKLAALRNQHKRSKPIHVTNDSTLGAVRGRRLSVGRATVVGGGSVHGLWIDRM